MQIKRRWQGLHWLCICIFILVLLSGCQQQAADDIVVLYTNDVHCAVDAGIGYAGLSAYKQWMEEQTPYVTLVDCGDAVQGDVIGTVGDTALAECADEPHLHFGFFVEELPVDPGEHVELAAN